MMAGTTNDRGYGVVSISCCTNSGVVQVTAPLEWTYGKQLWEHRRQQIRLCTYQNYHQCQNYSFNELS